MQVNINSVDGNSTGSWAVIYAVLGIIIFMLAVIIIIICFQRRSIARHNNHSEKQLQAIVHPETELQHMMNNSHDRDDDLYRNHDQNRQEQVDDNVDDDHDGINHDEDAKTRDVGRDVDVDVDADELHENNNDAASGEHQIKYNDDDEADDNELYGIDNEGQIRTISGDKNDEYVE